MPWGLVTILPPPHAYQGQQSAGFYTGGSVFARNSVRNVQIADRGFTEFSLRL